MQTSYDIKYSQGGWNYDRDKEVKRLSVLIEGAGLKPPATLIEIACGQGFHTNLLHEMGFKVVGSDLSTVGIENAKKAYPHIEFFQGNSMDMPARLGKEVFDGLVVRGHTHHHYDLPVQGKNQKHVDVVLSTQRMFDLVKPGGHVMMTVRTNFAGGLHNGKVRNNELGAYVKLFMLFGNIVHLSDVFGEVIRNDAHARELGRKHPDTGVVVVTRKPLR